MDLFGTVFTATAAIEAFAALLFGCVFLRRPADREYAAATLLAIWATLHEAGAILSAHAEGAAVALAAQRASSLGLIGALALALHYAYVAQLDRRPWPGLTLPYGVAVAVAAIDLRYGVGASFSPARGVQYVGSVATQAFALATATAVLWIAAIAYTSGRRGSLAVVLGAAALLAAVLNDFGVACGTLGTAHVTDMGLAALIVGIATTASARHASVARELELRTGDLRARTQELRRSHDDLRVVREELAKKEQLAVVGELAAVIAHEVRNPLAIIANAGAGLRKQALSWEDHETLLAILDEETSRLNRLVSDLLRYARPISVQRTHVALGDLLERALSPAKGIAKRIRVEFRREAYEGRIWGDSNLLRQVFDNVIDNAVQAMGQGGALTIRIRAATEGGVEGVAVDVIDTGEGMDTLVRSRALDPFFTTRPSGTGLGLAIVDRIVEAHGGRLGIASHSGDGTTVTVFLPHGSSSDLPVQRGPISKSPSDPARSASES